MSLLMSNHILYITFCRDLVISKTLIFLNQNHYVAFTKTLLMQLENKKNWKHCIIDRKEISRWGISFYLYQLIKVSRQHLQLLFLQKNFKKWRNNFSNTSERKKSIGVSVFGKVSNIAAISFMIWNLTFMKNHLCKVPMYHMIHYFEVESFLIASNNI